MLRSQAARSRERFAVSIRQPPLLLTAKGRMPHPITNRNLKSRTQFSLSPTGWAVVNRTRRAVSAFGNDRSRQICGRPSNVPHLPSSGQSPSRSIRSACGASTSAAILAAKVRSRSEFLTSFQHHLRSTTAARPARCASRIQRVLRRVMTSIKPPHASRSSSATRRAVPRDGSIVTERISQSRLAEKQTSRSAACAARMACWRWGPVVW
jgi:hypothetical protein